MSESVVTETLSNQEMPPAPGSEVIPIHGSANDLPSTQPLAPVAPGEEPVVLMGRMVQKINELTEVIAKQNETMQETGIYPYLT